MPWWPRLCIAVAIALASVALLGRRLPPGAAMTRGSYDLSLRLSAPWNPVISTGEVVIVYIDVVSHDELGQSPIQPWDRRLHADLVRRLTAAGARAIVFDIIFDTEWANAAVDDEFAAAMRDSKRVILGAEVAEGQGLVVVEAMKMENELKAPKAGKVTEVLVKEGVTVENGAQLVVVE